MVSVCGWWCRGVNDGGVGGGGVGVWVVWVVVASVCGCEQFT